MFQDSQVSKIYQDSTIVEPPFFMKALGEDDCFGPTRLKKKHGHSLHLFCCPTVSNILVILNLWDVGIWKIRHRAARHQWSVSGPLSWFPVLGSWDCSFRGGQGDTPHDPFSCRVTFVQVCFCCVFLYPFSATLKPKKHLKMESKSNQNRWKKCVAGHLGKSVQKCTCNLDFSALSQEADVLQI